MREWIEVTGKTVEDAVTEALIRLQTTSENIDYEVIEKESSGFLGLNRKPARVRAALKKVEITAAAENLSMKDRAVGFLTDIFNFMEIKPEVVAEYNEEEKTLNIDIVGEEMGILIGKRGQTLDSLQYLVSLVINKNSEEYVKVKLDTENYRERRKETLENLAKNIAFKVKKTGKSVSLEAMNPYERRIIHSTLQNDKAVETHSEGEEPYRKVVVTLKKGYRDYGSNRNYGNRSGSYHRNDNYHKPYNKPYRKPYQYGNTETVEKSAEKTEE